MSFKVKKTKVQDTEPFFPIFEKKKEELTATQKIPTGKIMTVEEFNRIGMQDYDTAVKNFEFGKGGFPAPSLYTFIDSRGDFKKYGYVGKMKRGTIWRPTKKEVLAEMQKEGVR